MVLCTRLCVKAHLSLRKTHPPLRNEEDKRTRLSVDAHRDSARKLFKPLITRENLSTARTQLSVDRRRKGSAMIREAPDSASPEKWTENGHKAHPTLRR